MGVAPRQSQPLESATNDRVVSDIFQWRERPWTLRVIAVIGVMEIAFSLATDFVFWNVVGGAIALALLWGLWRGSPGVRLYYILVLLVAVVMSIIGVVNDPSEHWDGFVASVAILALLLAPPTHEWARRREQEREQQRAQRRRSSLAGEH